MKKYENFHRHLAVLSRAGEQDLENEFVVSGIIDKFFLQFELGWKTLKDLLAYEGVDIAKTGSPRDIVKAAFPYYESIDEETWLAMLSQRNSMAHVYDETAARDLVGKILSDYIPAFRRLDDELQRRYGDLLHSL